MEYPIFHCPDVNLYQDLESNQDRSPFFPDLYLICNLLSLCRLWQFYIELAKIGQTPELQKKTQNAKIIKKNQG